jgi:primosomal protein N'
VRSRTEERAQSSAEDLARHILKKKPAYLLELTGPCRAFVYKLRRQFRWNIILKVRELEEFNPKLKRCLKEFRKPSGVILTIDVDPV